jgi:hypothetical protein
LQPLALHLLAAADAAAFLLDRTPHRCVEPDDPAAAAAIATALDGLALALEQAGAYIEQKRLSLAEYLAHWQARRSDVLQWHDEALTGYPASVAVTWEATFAQLGATEQSLLAVLSWLAPEPIPLALFDSECLAAAVTEPRAALAGLAAYALVRFAAGDDAVEVHRLVQAITRSRQGDRGAGDALKVALEIVDHLFPFDSYDVRTWSVLGPLSAHAAAVAGHADSAGIAQPTAGLMHRLGMYFWARDGFRAAEPLLRRAIAIDERS